MYSMQPGSDLECSATSRSRGAPSRPGLSHGKANSRSGLDSRVNAARAAARAALRRAGLRHHDDAKEADSLAATVHTASTPSTASSPGSSRRSRTEDRGAERLAPWARRDGLLADREDWEAACASFAWPALDEFNWALDWFDGFARGNDAVGL